MEFSNLKEMSKCGENKTTDKFQNRKEKDKSTTPYVNTTIVPDNTSTIQNEDHEYEVLQQTTQLQSIKAQEGGLCERIKKQLIYIILVIQVMLIVAVVVIAVIISSSKSTQQDGSWNDWESWGRCSVTCGYGMERRNRTCSDQTGGNRCYGDSTEYKTCNNGLCQDQSNQKVDGGWSVWGPWSGCSASCNTGMASRNRSCSSPKPSNGGDYCSGETAEYLLCNNFACPDPDVGFTVYVGDSFSGFGYNPLKFLSTLFNSDSSFNNLTGVFTCIYPGLYFFSATVMRTSTDGEYFCYFMVNNISRIRVLANDNSNSDSYPGSSASIVLRLNKNDRVNLGRCNDGLNMFPPGVSFTGFRISH